MEKLTSIVKDTLSNLEKTKQDATPNAYHKEFCKVAKTYDLEVCECTQFKELVEKLSKQEQKEIEKKEITTMEDMIPILLKRIATKNLKTLSSILSDAMTPSLHVSIDDNLTKFSLQIGSSPELIFEEDIQKEMQKFITKRFEADKDVVKQKTADIAKLITLMGQYLNDAINSNQNGTSSVSVIKNELELIKGDHNLSKDLSGLQSKLISAAITIENEMDQVSQRLTTGKDQILGLEQKVKLLEKQLTEVKVENTKDHLTGLLTRKAFEKDAQRVETAFARNSVDYALIFFDLDHFKKINDNFGHKAGDVVLSTFAKVLKKQTRKMDTIGRYGGEEFIALVSYLDTAELIHYLKRIKSIVTTNDFLYNNEKIRITFSAGVTLRVNHNSYDETIKKADELLYESKNSGRNQIRLEDGTVL